MKSRFYFPGWPAAALTLAAPLTVQALPAFVRQVDQPCITCHVEFPILNPFGRNFKLSGYTAQADTADSIPLAFLLQPSFTHTATAQAGGAAPGFASNNNFALTQASVFYAGRLVGPFGPKDPDATLNHIGVFLQATYDGVGHVWQMDDAEVRYAKSITLADQDGYWGMYANNNPTMQDVWNTTPAWSFPFSGSSLAPGPAAGLQLDGSLAAMVYGCGTYLWWNDLIYAEVGAYHDQGARFQSRVGNDAAGSSPIVGWAPYWRLAVEKHVGEAHWEFGLFGLSSHNHPGGDASAGTDRLLDVGLDSQYQINLGKHDFTAMLTWEMEQQTWGASSALGNTTHGSDRLREFKPTLHYMFDMTYAATVQYFSITGTRDPLLYADSANGSPTSDGFNLQLSYLPLNKNGGPAFRKRSNVKFSLLYTIYHRFNGAGSNYDGNGANAKDNNTLYFEAWTMF